MDSFPFSMPLALTGVFLCLYVWSGVWIYRDAQRRGKPALLVTVLVLAFAWPIGVLVWIAIRPGDGGPRRFNLDDYRAN